MISSKPEIVADRISMRRSYVDVDQELKLSATDSSY